MVKRGVTVNLEEETNKANKYLSDTFGVKPMLFQGGKLYHFDNIENVDSIIEELLNILKEENPIEFAFCIQLNGDLEKISKLISLQNFNKITACSDTIYRYNLNINHNFKAQSIGVYQYSGDTINVYEIKNCL